MIYLDIESRSTVGLKKAGAYRYAEDPTTEVIILAYAEGDGPVHCLTDPLEIRATFRYWLGRPKIAHNAQFDRVVLSQFCGLELDDPADWDDTMALAAEHGYPRSLADLAKALRVEEKDTAGTRLINLFSKPNRAGGFNDTETHPEQWAEFMSYAAQDVETLRQVHQALPGWPSAVERQLWIVDQRINDRGIQLDVNLADRASRAGAENHRRAGEELAEVLGIDNARSVQQVREGLAGVGLELGDLRADTVREQLDRDDLTAEQRTALELRQEIGLSSGKKFDAALATVCDDGRVRGTLKFYSAVSGRWGGAGIQPQNLTSASIDHPESSILDLQLDHDLPNAELKALVRPMLLGPMVVVDFSAIEARVLAWLAGELWLLDAFRAGRDIYVETGNRMGISDRSRAKAAVLGCGFGGGIMALKNVGTPGTDSELQVLVNRWREANPKIVKLWDQMERAMWSGGPAGQRLHVTAERGIRRLQLPSGRELVYRGVHVEDGKFGRELRYRGDRGVRTLSRMVSIENPTQAIARDLLAEALIRLDAAGWPVTMHVHDEIVAEGEGLRSVAEMEELMCQEPEWADGLPLAAEGYTAERYRK